MSKINRVDHITYAVAEGMIEKWGWYHIEVEGGSLTKRVDDVRPDDPNSSMKLWCIDFQNFGIVLVEGIDREKTSQVSAFVNRHGDHSVQHIAFDTPNLEQFVTRAMRMGTRLRGSQLVNDDGFGTLKQLFGKGYAEQDAAEMSFPEYIERPRGGQTGEEVNTDVPQNTGKNFYQRIEDARESKDTSTLTNFSMMPDQWSPEISKVEREPEVTESRKAHAPAE